MGITKIGLKRPLSALMIILSIIVVGILSFRGKSVELIPEVRTPVLMVHTSYEGADPETVDASVSKVIEETAEILNGIQKIQSYSYDNYSIVILTYEHGTDSLSNYMKLQNALAETKKSLPEGCGEPVIIEMDMETQPSMKISAHAEEEKEVLAFLHEGMLEELENLPAAAKVEVFGGKMNYIRVELKHELLGQYGLTLGQVAEYMASANFSVPIGTVQQGNQQLDVTSAARSNDLQDMKDIPLRTGTGGLIRLADIANVSWAVKNADSISHYNGEENVTISITKSRRASDLELSKQVGKVLEKYEDQNNQVEFEIFYDGGNEILSSVKSLGIALLIGTLLAILLVVLFLGDFKSALVVAGSVLLSLLLTMIGMNVMQFSVNIITMGALIVATALLIETSIVVLKNCFKVRRNQPDRKEAVTEAVKIVGKSVIVSVAVTAAVCLPLLFLEGLSAQLFTPLGYLIVFAAVASLLDAAMFVPLLFVLLKPEEKTEGKFLQKLNKLEEGYGKLLEKLLKRKEVVLSVAILLFAISCATLIYADKELITESDNGIVNITVDFRSGIQASEIEDKIIVLEELLDDYKEVESYSTTVSGSSAEIQVQLKDGSKTSCAKFREKLKGRTEDYVGIDIRVSNVSNMSELELSDAEEVIIAGYRLEDVKEAAKQLSERYRKIPGVMSVISSVETEGTKLEVVIDPLRAMNYGMTSAQVAEKLQEMVSGQEVMTLEEGDRSYRVWLEYPEGVYTTPQNLINAGIVTPDGLQVPLANIAELKYTDAQECIVRKDGKYLATLMVTCPEKYRDDVRAGMEKAWSKLNTAASITREKSAVEELMNVEFQSLFYAIGIAVFFVFVVLTIRYESVKYALAIMLSIPLGLFGAFLLMFFTGSAWNLVSMIGILLLIEMMIVQCIRYIEIVGTLARSSELEDALVEGSKELLPSLLLTTLAVIAVVLPMAVWPAVGTVLMRGMAVVMIGGMISGSALILLVLPVTYRFLCEEEEEETEEDSEPVCDEINE